MSPRTWPVDPAIAEAAEQHRVAAGLQWHDTPDEQAARRMELRLADDWWRSLMTPGRAA